MNKDLHTAVTLVIGQGLSMNAASRETGVAVSTLRLALMKNPDYVRAKAEGKTHAKIGAEGVSDEEIKNHPAVLAVVRDGKTYEQAGLEFGKHASTVHNWVVKAYPEVAAARSVAYPTSAAKAAKTAAMQQDMVVKTLLASLKAASEQLGVAPKALCNQLAEML